MSETTSNAKGPAPVTYKPAATEPTLIPADQVKPEDIGKLSIEYRDGQPVVVVSGGTVIPAHLPVVGSGAPTPGYARVRDLATFKPHLENDSHWFYLGPGATNGDPIGR
ncbi:hypothetical protein Snoj_82120 [Streptomyces nojiriensis]|uniref:Uncharacterized protein n=1 Tax=Streptomyces nojiriensis TaxID=66374 RepID=A0ABQ3T1L9_9ACTN|nr:hypothetical protein [Streptomyces nojiriensis]QTI47788.1 hypothetical protein JYK04_05639 [Streptomyces nojiriensis]GGR75461.1 hypothetical protein GCM10010205_00200 [Streptomyces nojiriensis]GHI74294.1 hypothetical protein Snoj_82120 [Streptomyces nojiriensis]